IMSTNTRGLREQVRVIRVSNASADPVVGGVSGAVGSVRIYAKEVAMLAPASVKIPGRSQWLTVIGLLAALTAQVPGERPAQGEPAGPGARPAAEAVTLRLETPGLTGIRDLVVDDLADPDPEVQVRAYQKLRKIGRAALPTLCLIRNNSNPEQWRF